VALVDARDEFLACVDVDAGVFIGQGIAALVGHGGTRRMIVLPSFKQTPGKAQP